MMDPIARPRTKSNPFGAQKDTYCNVASALPPHLIPRKKKLTISADVSNSFDSQLRLELPSRPAVSMNPFESDTPNHQVDKNKNSNPFETNFQEKKVDAKENLNPFSSHNSEKRENLNPFEDVCDEGSLNPFDENYKGSGNPFD